jgi:hypothetical protein
VQLTNQGKVATGLPGTDFTNLHFGRKLFGPIFSVKCWAKLHLETADINYGTITNNNIGF